MHNRENLDNTCIALKTANCSSLKKNLLSPTKLRNFFLKIKAFQ